MSMPFNPHISLRNRVVAETNEGTRGALFNTSREWRDSVRRADAALDDALMMGPLTKWMQGPGSAGGVDHNPIVTTRRIVLILHAREGDSLAVMRETNLGWELGFRYPGRTDWDLSWPRETTRCDVSQARDVLRRTFPHCVASALVVIMAHHRQFRPHIGFERIVEDRDGIKVHTEYAPPFLAHDFVFWALFDPVVLGNIGPRRTASMPTSMLIAALTDRRDLLYRWVAARMGPPTQQT